MEHENLNLEETANSDLGDVSGSFLSKIKWYEKLFFYMVCGGIVLAIMIMMPKIKRHSQIRADVKRKLKYFNPIISEGFLGKKITWVSREKPLTNDELEKLL